MGVKEKLTETAVAKKASPLEMEPMVQSSDQQSSSPATRTGRLQSLIILIKLYVQYYPGITSCIAAAIVAITVLSLVHSLRKPVTRNRLHHEYAKIDMTYNFMAADVDHWCLWGGDDDCTCDDFTTPLSREEKKGWVKTHSKNVDRIDDTKDFDVIFYGDETVEGWNGEGLGLVLKNPDALKTKDYFKKTFTKEGGGEFEGLALGTMGDVSPNLLWRLRHGEMPPTLQSKVFWLMTGVNDLVRGGCSEEVTLLGILRLADEIYFSNPDSVIVIQGILPWTKSRDGSLAPDKRLPKLFGQHINEKPKSVEAARKYARIWPSIQHVNAELEKFCAYHEHLVYFDASSLFLGSMGNQVYQSKEQHIIPALMSNGKTLTAEGYKVLGDAILKELERIIYDENEANDVETVGGQHHLR